MVNSSCPESIYNKNAHILVSDGDAVPRSILKAKLEDNVSWDTVSLCIDFIKSRLKDIDLLLLEEIHLQDAQHTYSSFSQHISKAHDLPISSVKYSLTKLRDHKFIKSGSIHEKGRKLELDVLGKMIIKELV